jgi:hypothetical protein
MFPANELDRLDRDDKLAMHAPPACEPYYPARLIQPPMISRAALMSDHPHTTAGLIDKRVADRDRLAPQTNPGAVSGRQDAPVPPRVRTFFECDAPARKEAPQSRDAEPQAPLGELSLQLGERDVGFLLDPAQDP